MIDLRCAMSRVQINKNHYNTGQWPRRPKKHADNLKALWADGRTDGRTDLSMEELLSSRKRNQLLHYASSYNDLDNLSEAKTF